MCKKIYLYKIVQSSNVKLIWLSMSFDIKIKLKKKRHVRTIEDTAPQDLCLMLKILHNKVFRVESWNIQ